MLRLTVITQTRDEAELRIDGRVDADTAPVLAAEGDRLLGCSHRLRLDLQGVPHIDAAGLALLERWVALGVTLHNGRFFVRELLKGRGLIAGPGP